MQGRPPAESGFPPAPLPRSAGCLSSPSECSRLCQFRPRGGCFPRPAQRTTFAKYSQCTPRPVVGPDSQGDILIHSIPNPFLTYPPQSRRGLAFPIICTTVLGSQHSRSTQFRDQRATGADTYHRHSSSSSTMSAAASPAPSEAEGKKGEVNYRFCNEWYVHPGIVSPRPVEPTDVCGAVRICSTPKRTARHPNSSSSAKHATPSRSTTAHAPSACTSDRWLRKQPG